MPESFDTLLAELADAAASTVAAPDPAAVRRRARQRTVHHRMTASALALVLLGVSGGTLVAVQHRQGRDAAADGSGRLNGVNTAPSEPSPTGAHAPPNAASGTASVEPSTSGAAGVIAMKALLGVWADASKQDGYLMVFPDGVVALSDPGSFPLCSAQVEPAASASASSAVLDASSGSTTTVSMTDGTCSDLSGVTGETIGDPKGDSMLTLSVPANKTGVGFTSSYARVPSVSLAGTGDKRTLSQFVGQWSSVDSEHRYLKVDGNGSVDYAWLSDTANFANGTGTIDEYIGDTARVVTNCPSGGSASTCGVLLIAPGKTASQIIVYGSYGPETFARTH